MKNRNSDNREITIIAPKTYKSLNEAITCNTTYTKFHAAVDKGDIYNSQNIIDFPKITLEEYSKIVNETRTKLKSIIKELIPLVAQCITKSDNELLISSLEKDYADLCLLKDFDTHIELLNLTFKYARAYPCEMYIDKDVVDYENKNDRLNKLRDEWSNICFDGIVAARNPKAF